ncbi:T9SS type A sorting domain-containing protein [Rufibacter immobilis]
MLLLFVLVTQAQAQGIAAVANSKDKSLQVKYSGATTKDVAPGLVKLSFTVSAQGKNDKNLETIFFELPAGAGAISPVGAYQSKGKKYKVEAAVKAPFHAIRFTAVGGKKEKSKKKVKEETFSYVLSEAEFASMSSIKVRVKSNSGTKDVTVPLNKNKRTGAADVTTLATCTTPLPVISGSPDLCPGEIVKFAIKENMDYQNIQWSVPTVGSDGKPSNWEILSVTGKYNNVLEVRVGDVSGTVYASVDVANCGTKVVSKATYIGDEIPVTISVVNGTQTGKEEFNTGDVMVFNANANQNRDKREYIYDWEVPVGWTIVSGQGTNQLIVIAGAVEGFVELNVKSRSDRELRYCGLGYAYVEVIQEPKEGCPKPDIDVDAPEEVCDDSENVYRFAVTNPDPNKKVKYQFFLPDEFQVVASGYGWVDIKVNNAKADSTLFVTIVAVNANNCGAEAICIPVDVKDCPTGPCEKPVVSLVAPDTICNLADEPTTIRVAQTQPGVTYTFNVPEGFLVIEEGPDFVTVVAVFDEEQLGQPQTISVTARNECGVTTAQETLIVADCGNGNPLPVTLTRFEGVSRNGSVELAWSTASEINNDRFEIERSTNGKDFVKVGEVKGMGNSSALVDYTYSDRNTTSGTVYYRLRQVDYDAAFEYSKVIAVSHVATASSASAISLYPNPVNDGNLTVRFEELVKGHATIRLVDLNGRVLHTQELSSVDSEVAMNLSGLNLRAGIYMISVTANGRNTTQRIMIR